MLGLLPTTTPLCTFFLTFYPFLAGHDVTADVPVDGEDEDRLGREEAQRRRRESGLPCRVDGMPCHVNVVLLAAFRYPSYLSGCPVSVTYHTSHDGSVILWAWIAKARAIPRTLNDPKQVRSRVRFSTVNNITTSCLVFRRFFPAAPLPLPIVVLSIQVYVYCCASCVTETKNF